MPCRRTAGQRPRSISSPRHLVPAAAFTARKPRVHAPGLSRTTGVTSYEYVLESIRSRARGPRPRRVCRATGADGARGPEGGSERDGARDARAVGVGRSDRDPVRYADADRVPGKRAHVATNPHTAAGRAAGRHRRMARGDSPRRCTRQEGVREWAHRCPYCPAPRVGGALPWRPHARGTESRTGTSPRQRSGDSLDPATRRRASCPHGYVPCGKPRSAPCHDALAAR